jgi:hypothetical protein
MEAGVDGISMSGIEEKCVESFGVENKKTNSMALVPD